MKYSNQIYILIISFFLFVTSSIASPLRSIERLEEDLKSTKIKLSKVSEENEKLRKKFLDLEKEIKVLKKNRKETRKEKYIKKEKSEKPSVTIGGALWLNYAYKDWDTDSRGKGGDYNFDVFRLDINGSLGDFLISAQYRFYSFMDVLHHGWLGYRFNKNWMGKLGVFQVPFGITPYASNSYWFGVPYYLGLEDDYDAGFGIEGKEGPWNMSVAFFKNAEYGNASKTDRYSFDLVKASGQNNEESNQVNGRLTYTFDLGLERDIEVGGSGQWGQVFNGVTDSSGDHWSFAGHLNMGWDQIRLMLEGIRYEYDPANPSGISSKTVVLGGFADNYEVAAKGNIFVGNISYTLPFTFGYIRSILLYNDFSVLMKDEDNFESSHLNTIGLNFDMGSVFVYVNAIMGKNQIFIGAPANAMAAGDPNEDWRTRFNINVELFF